MYIHKEEEEEKQGGGGGKKRKKKKNKKKNTKRKNKKYTKIAYVLNGYVSCYKLCCECEEESIR